MDRFPIDDIPSTPGVYLLHADDPYLARVRIRTTTVGRPQPEYKAASHYIGYASDLRHRIDQHQRGQGARLVAVWRDSDLTFQVARLWTGADRFFERYLKDGWKSAARICPLCSPGALACCVDGNPPVAWCMRHYGDIHTERSESMLKPIVRNPLATAHATSEDLVKLAVGLSIALDVRSRRPIPDLEPIAAQALQDDLAAISDRLALVWLQIRPFLAASDEARPK